MCHVVLMCRRQLHLRWLILTPTPSQSLFGTLAHHPLPQHPRRRRRGRVAPHARPACAEPSGKLVCWLRVCVFDVSDVLGWQITPPPRIPVPFRCTTVCASPQTLGVFAGIQHTDPDTSETKAFVMVSHTHSHREGQPKRVIVPEDFCFGQTREEIPYVRRGLVTGLILGLDEHSVHRREAH